MTITIEWATGIISVLKVDMELVQSVPTVIYKLDLNVFRLALKDLEDDPAGMGFQKTHDHNTTITIGGVTLARVINILPPYTVTFEDDQYAVNLINANSNVADRTNVNQVSVRSANSAGLITSDGIEALEYERGVHIDVANGTTGTLYPRGTHRLPVNNLADAQLIASVRGFRILYIMGTLTLGASDDVGGYILVGMSPIDSEVIVTSGCSTEMTEFRKMVLSGGLDGEVMIREDCHIRDLTGLEGHLHGCILKGNIVLAGSEDIDMIDCASGVPGGGTPVIDMGGDGPGLGLRAYAGGIKLINKSGSASVSVDFVSGQLKLANTVTDGTIVVRGAGWISEPYQTGTTIIRDNGLINPGLVWDELTADHEDIGSTGEALGTLKGRKLVPSP